nr:MAG TPA: hypothetical protein [Caudoviricetes sp.]
MIVSLCWYYINLYLQKQAELIMLIVHIWHTLRMLLMLLIIQELL